MTDSQDLTNQTLRFTTTPEERKIIRDRLNLFTKPLEKKSVSHTLGGMCGDKPVITQKGGVGASFRYTQKANTSLKSNLNGGQNGY
jgi:hypothetical protein